MEFTEFPNDPRAASEVPYVINRELAVPSVYKWSLLEQTGFAQPLLELIEPTFSDGFVESSLRICFQNEHVIYKPLLVEFVASINIDDITYDKGFNLQKIIHFRLCGKQFHMNLLEFARCLGFYSSSGERKLYLTHLNQARSDGPPDYNTQELWDEIGMEVFKGSDCKETHLANPVIRLLHRFLVHTILFSGQPDKVNGERLVGLHYILRRRRWHIPLVIANMFYATRMGRNTKLNGGQFVTQIASSLGLLTEEVKRRCGMGKEQNWQGKNQMVKSMYLKRLPNGDYMQYAIGEKKDGEPSNRGKRSRAGTSQPEEPTINLQYVVNQNHEVGRYLNEVTALQWNADRRAEIRHRTPFDQPYPADYNSGWVYPATWETRMEGLNLGGNDEEGGA